MNNTRFVHFKKFTKRRNGSFLAFCVVAIFLVFGLLSSFALFQNERTYELASGKYINDTCEYEDGKTWTFNYNGTSSKNPSVQKFTVPCDGVYKLEVWGAQGGNYGSATGGKGGYSYGNKTLQESNILYIAVGGQNNNFNGSYNFSVTNSDRGGAGGGGATHIALVTGTLADIGYTKFVTNKKGLIVAGGGGGAGYQGASGAGGSGYIGGVSKGKTQNGVKNGNGKAVITYLGKTA